MRSSTPYQHESTELRAYLEILYRRKMYILGTFVILIGLTVLYLARQADVYSSTSQVLVIDPGLSPTQSPVGFINMETERSLAASPQVAEFAKRELESALSAQQLLGGLSVDVQPETEILVFTYQSRRADEVQARAQAFADGYLDYRARQYLNEILKGSEAIQEEVNATEGELKEVNSELADTVDPTQRDVLETRARALQARLDLLQRSITLPVDSPRVGQVVQPASTPAPNDNSLQILVLAGFLGLAVGVGVAFLVERLDDRVGGREDLEKHSASAVLAVVPKIPEWEPNGEPFLAVTTAPYSPAAEAYRTLRTGILFAASQRSIVTLLVTSAEGGEGKTATTANLGAALARAGKRVILVSGDLRKPRLQDFFDVSNGLGLTNILAREKSIMEVLVQPDEISNLRILNSGPVPGNPSELLSSSGMQEVLMDLRREADIILIDGAPILPVADSLILSRLSDAVLFVAQSHKTSKSDVDHAREQLSQMDARVIGSVLNNLDPRKGSGYSAYGAYRYAHKAQ